MQRVFLLHGGGETYSVFLPFGSVCRAVTDKIRILVKNVLNITKLEYFAEIKRKLELVMSYDIVEL